MSLINDALKRASSPKSTPAPPPGGPPLQPVESSSDRSGPLPIILCIVGIGALLMAGGFWLKSRGTPQTVVVEKPSSATAPIESKPTLVQNPGDRANATLEKVVERTSEQTPTNVAAATVASTAPPSTPIATPPPEPVKAQPAPPAPTFQLQAIYFRMKGPTVVINGQTVKVGDHVDGAKLVSIERNSAEIEYEGKTERLTVH